jgi:hypothetical protein
LRGITATLHLYDAVAADALARRRAAESTGRPLVMTAL